MIYPNFLKIGDKVGVCAPSDGLKNEIDLKRFDFAKENIKKLGLNIVETSSCRSSKIGRSSEAKIRALELESLFSDNSVNSIFCLAGGDFLLEILPYINFDNIIKNPKWLQGYSDPTGLLFTITTNLDIATIYGYNFKTFGMENWHASLNDDIDLLFGRKLEFNSYEYYEENSLDYVIGNEGFNLDTKTSWSVIGDVKESKLRGRIIGGCLDVLLNLVGTKFDNTKNFIKKYEKDGIIWYFDNCELTSEGVIRAMWQIKNSGWFEGTKAIVFGRSATNASYYDISFKEAVKSSLEDLNIPIILDADIGHKLPQLPVINGSVANIHIDKNLCKIEYELAK